MELKRLGVLRGGAGEYYDSSIERGGEVISFVLHRMPLKYKPIDILIDQDGLWHLGGIPILPSDLMRGVDLVWNASHPKYSDTLERFSIPHVSVPRSFHGLKESREKLREHLARVGIRTPRGIISDEPLEVFEKISPPWLINGEVVKTFPELVEILGRLENPQVEEWISDKEAKVHAIGEYRREKIYVLPIEEKLIEEEKNNLARLARALYEHMDAKHYLHASFYLHPKRGVFLKELEFLPDVNPNSHLHTASELIGVPAHSIVEHMLARVMLRS